MSKNKEIGIKGESIAVDYLKNSGYDVRETNFIYNRNEIDIITVNNDTLIFIEVKTRQGTRYGMPEEAVDEKKIDKILECANHYIESIGWKGPIRFDILSIMITPTPVIKHIKDAFF